MANTHFISSSVRIRSPPKRRISADRNDNGNTASIYFVQHKVVPCKSETLFDDDILFAEEKTLYVNGDSCYSFDNITQNGKGIEPTVDNSVELDLNSNVILENKILPFNQPTLFVDSMIDLSDHTPPASFDEMYENGRLFSKLGESNSELNRSVRPAKPKRTLKFDRDRCTFIEGSSVDDVATKVPFLQKELDAFIQSEKHKFSGVVEECFDASMTSIDPDVSFNELAPWIRNVYLEKLQAHMSKDNKEELTLQQTDKKETSYDFLNHSLPSPSPVKTFPSKDFYTPSSERKPKKDCHTNPSPHVKEVAKLLDSQIRQLQILLADINCNEIDTELSSSETTKQSFIDLSPATIEAPRPIEPNRRTELPRLPDEKRHSKILWLNPDGIRSTMTNLKHRFSRISDSKMRKFSFQQSKRKSDGCLRYSNSHLKNEFDCKTSPKQISKAFEPEHDTQMKNESDFQKKQV